ncbi:MAG: AAA family ATPase [Candidatus Acidiferrales bacterium]
MFVRRLTLKNFRSHQETVLELDRFNFIRGPNSCGKSSIRMALEYLFTGRCGLADSAGRGAEALIRAGEKEFAVSATLSNGETISRHRTRRSQTVEINGKRMPVDAAGSFIGQKFASGDVLSAVLNADKFVEMSATEQRRFLAQLVEAGSMKIPEEICRTLGAIDEEIPRSLADLDAAYTHFHDLRAETNRALELLGQLMKGERESDLVEGGFAGDQAERWAQQAEKTDWSSFRQPDLDPCQKIAESPSRRIETDFDESSFEIPSLWEEDDLRLLGSPVEHAKELNRQLAELRAERQAADASLAVMRGWRDKCPTCGQPISDATRAGDTDRLCKRLADIKDQIRRTREELNCYVVQEALPEGDVQRRVSIEPAHNLEQRSKIQAKVESRAHPVQGQKCALETRLRILDRLIEFFGPNGAITRETSTRMEAFERNLNQHLSGFGYACRLTFEPFEICISLLPGGASLALRQLSESERFRFGIAFQIALAVTTGIRFIVIDRADMFDKARRKLLTALLLGSDVEQAIVLATTEESVPSQVPEGVKFLNLDEQLRT